MSTRVPRTLALLLSLGVSGAVVFQACSRGAPSSAPPEPVVLPEPAAVADPEAAAATPPATPAESASAPAATQSPPPPPPDFMGASKAAPVFHPHPPQPASALPAQLAP